MADDAHDRHPGDATAHRISRRALIAGAGAAGALAACSQGGDDRAARAPGTTSTTAQHSARSGSETPGETSSDAPDRVVDDGEHFPDGVVVPAGETWALAPGAHVTSAGNVVVEGTLVLHQTDPSRTMRLTFVDVDEAAFVGSGSHEVEPTDVGLWMVHSGRLDVRGAAKTSWTRLAGTASAGDREIVVEDADGWRVGDEVAVTPTAPLLDDGDPGRSDRAVVASVNGARIGLEAPLEHDHPVVGEQWRAEVVNLTRSVVIEGTPDHKAHIIFFHQGEHASPDFRASAISHLEVAHMGPNQPNDRGEPSSVVGRYALHFHHGGQSTEGVVVEGAVVHDCGAHAFVPHASDGITLRSCASVGTLGDAYWWDESDVSDYVVYDHCLASDVSVDGRFRYTTNGFFAAETDVPGSCAMLGCVAAGVRGADSGGYFWNNQSMGVWVFEDCLAHNIEHMGIRVWQNTSAVHPIDRFTAYHCATGIDHGAYTNPYQYHGATIHGCDTGVAVQAVSGGDDGTRMEFHDVAVSGCATDLVLHDAPVDAAQAADFRRCTFDGVVVSLSHGDTLKAWDFVDCDLAPDDFRVEELAGEVVLRTQTGGEAWERNADGDWHPTPTF